MDEALFRKPHDWTSAPILPRDRLLFTPAKVTEAKVRRKLKREVLARLKEYEEWEKEYEEWEKDERTCPHCGKAIE